MVNVATNRGKYLQWQRMLLNTFADFNIDSIAWHDDFPEGSPHHRDVPYAFKPLSLIHI